jgi:hypothetical protein
MASKKWPRQIFHSELSANLGAGLAGLRERHSAQVTVQPINANGSFFCPQDGEGGERLGDAGRVFWLWHTEIVAK